MRFCLGFTALTAVLAVAAEPCQSGLQSGQRPGPYSFLVSTGKARGQLTCFVCETEDRPAVIVFARSLTEPLGKLVGQVDRALTEHKKADLRAWVTFLSDDQPALDPKVVEWGKKYAIGTVPLGVFEDVVGPPRCSAPSLGSWVKRNRASGAASARRYALLRCFLLAEQR